jgi:hypothetical protein
MGEEIGSTWNRVVTHGKSLKLEIPDDCTVKLTSASLAENSSGPFPVKLYANVERVDLTDADKAPEKSRELLATFDSEKAGTVQLEATYNSLDIVELEVEGSSDVHVSGSNVPLSPEDDEEEEEEEEEEESAD